MIEHVAEVRHPTRVPLANVHVERSGIVEEQMHVRHQPDVPARDVPVSCHGLRLVGKP